jgi:hypothetical protein
MGGAMQPITPARLSTRAISNFDSVKPFRNSGMDAEWNAQTICVPKKPAPRMIIFGTLALGSCFTGIPLRLLA